MFTSDAKYEDSEIARMGQEIYERIVKPRLRPEDNGKYVAIDVDSGDYEVDQDDYTATERLLVRCAGAQIWLMRAGRIAAYRMGGHAFGKASE